MYVLYYYKYIKQYYPLFVGIFRTRTDLWGCSSTPTEEVFGNFDAGFSRDDILQEGLGSEMGTDGGNLTVTQEHLLDIRQFGKSQPVKESRGNKEGLVLFKNLELIVNIYSD